MKLRQSRLIRQNVGLVAFEPAPRRLHLRSLKAALQKKVHTNPEKQGIMFVEGSRQMHVSEPITNALNDLAKGDSKALDR
jgi:hypothetical protein